jgi:hypothetical protein
MSCESLERLKRSARAVVISAAIRSLGTMRSPPKSMLPMSYGSPSATLMLM